MGYTETGSKELAAALRVIGERMATEGALRAVKAGAQLILEAQIAHTSAFDHDPATKLGASSLNKGELKQSLKIRTSLKDGVAKAKIGPGDKRTRNAAYLVEYGHRQVVGGKSRMNKSGLYVGKGKAKTQDVPPEAFMRPAFEESAAAANEAMIAQVKQEIEKGNG